MMNSSPAKPILIFWSRHDLAQLAAPLGDKSVEQLHAAAAALAAQAGRREHAVALKTFLRDGETIRGNSSQRLTKDRQTKSKSNIDLTATG